jgi:hypothetical protein
MHSATSVPTGWTNSIPPRETNPAALRAVQQSSLRAGNWPNCGDVFIYRNLKSQQDKGGPSSRAGCPSASTTLQLDLVAVSQPTAVLGHSCHHQHRPSKGPQGFQSTCIRFNQPGPSMPIAIWSNAPIANQVPQPSATRALLCPAGPGLLRAGPRPTECVRARPEPRRHGRAAVRRLRDSPA